MNDKEREKERSKLVDKRITAIIADDMNLSFFELQRRARVQYKITPEETQEALQRLQQSNEIVIGPTFNINRFSKQRAKY